jgi:diacylglycerol kinase
MMKDSSMKSSDENHEHSFRLFGWKEKFAVAGRGINVAMSQEKSFLGHFTVAGVVIVGGFVLGISKIEWFVVVLCMMGGLSTELLNTAIERLAKAITTETNPHIRDALDIASGAVLIITLGAVVLGTMVFAPKIGRLIFGPS